MKKTLHIVLIGLLVTVLTTVVLTGCSSKPKNIDADTTEVAYEMKAEDTITIRLEENATTGYEWNYTIADAEVVEFVSDEFNAPSDTEMVGVPGEHVWVFKAIGSGSTTINFELSRSWEEGETPAETKEFQVTVK
ncbi:MAG: protease inhibitor I42 family protein [Caldisericia bacterium]|nr:protease inhibitor I42 family protein [Caldisericia bacterium]MDD4614053.1 protease inhibitor I42 family protein [Caldisericia bacterium]